MGRHVTRMRSARGCVTILSTNPDSTIFQTHRHLHEKGMRGKQNTRHAIMCLASVSHRQLARLFHYRIHFPVGCNNHMRLSKIRHSVRHLPDGVSAADGSSQKPAILKIA